jgi:hypothetical protein
MVSLFLVFASSVLYFALCEFFFWGGGRMNMIIQENFTNQVYFLSIDGYANNGPCTSCIDKYV